MFALPARAVQRRCSPPPPPYQHPPPAVNPTNGGLCVSCPAGATSPAGSVGLGACSCLLTGLAPAAANSTCAFSTITSSRSITTAQTGGAVGGAIGGAVLVCCCAAFWFPRAMRRRAEAEAKARGWKALVASQQDIVFGDELGSGGFASVFEADWKGTRVAIKVFASGLVVGGVVRRTRS